MRALKTERNKKREEEEVVLRPVFHTLGENGEAALSHHCRLLSTTVLQAAFDQLNSKQAKNSRRELAVIVRVLWGVRSVLVPSDLGSDGDILDFRRPWCTCRNSMTRPLENASSKMRACPIPTFENTLSPIIPKSSQTGHEKSTLFHPTQNAVGDYSINRENDHARDGFLYGYSHNGFPPLQQAKNRLNELVHESVTGWFYMASRNIPGTVKNNGVKFLV